MDNQHNQGEEGVVYWPSVCGNSSRRDAFWDPQQTVNTSSPVLPWCFQATVLVWGPCGLFWVLLPFYLIYLNNLPTKHSWRYRSKLNIAKIVLCIFLVAINLADLILAISSPGWPTVLYISPGVKVITFAGLAVITSLEFGKAIHSSGLQLILWFILTISAIVVIKTDAELPQRGGRENFYLGTGIVYLTLVAIQFLLSLLVDRRVFEHRATSPRSKNLLLPSEEVDEKTPLLGDGLLLDGHESKEALQHQAVEYQDMPPESTTSFLSKITYSWFTGLLIRGYRKPLEVSDVYKMVKEDHSHMVMDKFNPCWQKELQNTRAGKEPSLLKVLALSTGSSLLIGSFIRLVCLVFDFLNPVLLRMLIAYVSGPADFAWKGFLLSVGLFANNVMQAVLMQAQYKLNCYTGQRLRMAVTTAVYRKILRLSSAARRGVTAGQIVNLMSVDAQKMQDSCFFFASAWTTPVVLVISLVFIWQTVGPASMSTFIVLLVVVPLNVLYIGRRTAQLQRVQMKEKDHRIKLVNEILAGIKVLKLYAWEESFQDRVIGSRDNELKPIRTALNLSAISMCVMQNIPILMMLCIFSVFTMTSVSNVLDADKAFVTMSLISLMIQPLATLPMFIAFSVQAFISMKRVAKFLTLPEIDPDSIVEDATLGNAVVISDATLRWTEDSPPVLKNINVRVGHGQLVAVVGQVGSGKSSLVSAILGELSKDHGHISVGGNIAYVPQEAWMQNATLRDNVMFGKKWNSQYYHQVLQACALLPDLKILPGGDQTEIGEKGINLSGGQKQRVSLARAVYSRRDIYLLDDPLSAVDAHVGKHIFEQVIGPTGMLANKTRVLVTHAVTYLPQVDMIVVLTDGQVSEMGTYQQLLDHGGAFAKFLQNHASQDNGTEDISDEDVITRRLSAGSGSDQESSKRTLRKRSSASRKSLTSIDERKESRGDRAVVKLIEEEMAEVGSVQGAVLKWYMKAGGYLVTVVAFLSLLAFAVVSIFANIWLSEWTADKPINDSIQDRPQNEMRLGVYGALAAGQVITALINSMVIAYGCVAASRAIHTSLVQHILKAPMSFFDTTPLGRILNRFAKDMDILDNNLPMWLRMWMFTLPPVLSTIVVISYSTPIFLSVVLPLAVVYYLVQRVYIASVRQLKRLDSVLRSPIYAHFDESLVGINSIRAYKQEERFIHRSDQLVDRSQTVWYNIVIAQRWVGFWLQVLGAVVVFFASLFAVLERENITGGLVGMSVSYALQVTQMLNMLVRSSTELETYIVAVERIKEYSEIETEAPRVIAGAEPDPSWPSEGEISFEEYSTRYRAELDLVLRHLQCSVKPSEKVGIVGRTGAGKTSMTLALFRLIEPAAGSISIDQLNIAKMGLHDLRSKLSIIPQDPVVFSGSLRENLDPFNQYQDVDVWRALEQAHLKHFVENTEQQLGYDCGEGGEALSVGQRQLVCLARALLRHTKILVLDEATAAVDLETDELIQNTIRTEFKHCTVITIAHRLNTVMDYDRVMVLDKGEIKEFESPVELLRNRQSIFYSMARDAGLA